MDSVPSKMNRKIFTTLWNKLQNAFQNTFLPQKEFNNYRYSGIYNKPHQFFLKIQIFCFPI